MSAFAKKMLGMKDVLKEKLLQAEASSESSSTELPPEETDQNG